MAIEHVGTNVESTQYDTTTPDGVTSITETERGLLPNTRYAIRVRAFNNLGVPSNWSEAIEFGTASDDTVPATPQNLLLSTIDGHLTILWDNVTTNEDGTPLTDLAFYEILLQDNIEYGAGGDLLPPFRYTSIANSYTFLYSANKAIHDAVGEPPSDDWTVTVRAVDFSGNPSGDATNVQALSFGGGGSDFPVNFESTNYDGTSVEDHDATEGIKIQENGEAEFEDLRINGDLYVQNINAGSKTLAVFTRDSIQAISNTTNEYVAMETEHINRTFKKLNGSVWEDKELIRFVYGGINLVAHKTGWYNITITHKWEVNGDGARQAHMLIDGTLRNWGGHPAGGLYTTELHMFTDSRIFHINSGEIIVPAVRQDSGGALDLEYMQVTIELIQLLLI